MIKMVVADLDGTLLNEDHKVNDETAKTIKTLQATGIKFVIASGRNFYSLTNIIQKLQVDKYLGYVIGSNGQQLYDFSKQKLYVGEKLSEQQAYDIRQVCHRYRLNTIIIYDHHSYFTTNWLVKFSLRFKFFLKRINKNVDDVGFQDYISIPANKKIPGEANKICLLTNNKNKVAKVKKILEKEFDVLQLDGHWYEIMVKNVNKGVMLDKLMEIANIKNDEIMVFGDGENDVEMLAKVKYSYAMKNARDIVIETANYMADSNTDNGVIKVINKEILKI